MTSEVGQRCNWNGEPESTSRYVLTGKGGGIHEYSESLVISLDGVDWYSAPIPPRRHTCSVQTVGWIRLSQVFRCACGAISDRPNRGWAERNTRAEDRPMSAGQETPRKQPWWRRLW